MHADLPCTYARVALFVLALGAGAVLSAKPSYERKADIPIPGEGGWDYLSVDPAAHRLYVSHATQIVVIDTRTRAIVGAIANTPGVHGIALVPAIGRGFTSNGRENKVGVVDLASLATLRKVDTGANPDAIVLATSTREVYAFNGRSASATVIDSETNQVVATVPLGGKPEFAQEDPGAHRVYVNLEDRNEVAAIDTKTHTVVAHWPIGPGAEASGLALDVVHHRLFLGCSNALMMVLDSTDGHVVATIPAGEGIDAAAFDPGTQLAFVSNGLDGTVTVVHEDTPDRYSLVQTLATERSARTMTVDSVSHEIYLAAGKIEPGKDGARPRLVPGSMHVLVYGLIGG